MAQNGIMKAMGDARGEVESLRVLSFWWMLELFNPQQVPKVTRRASRPSDRQVIAWRAGEPLPWESLASPKPLNGNRRVWRHTVYLGIYKMKDTYESLAHVFGEDPETYDKRPDGESACAAVVVDENGQLVADSGVLSSALWAAGRAREPGLKDPRWMDGFESALHRFRDATDAFEAARCDTDGGEQPPPYDTDSLRALLGIAHVAASVENYSDLASDRVIIDSVAVSARRSQDGVDTDFLNSFYLDDLRLVREQVKRGNHGRGLTSYLTADAELAVADRVDVVSHPEAVDAGTVIGRIPRGRWPSNPSHALALSQQFAVNRALNDLDPGVMGVNGPPGTGKTTMLRDILAGNVVERARRLSKLSRPQDAFTDVTHRWSDGTGHARIVRQLRPELTGFEMVVASANNAAVENVTTEIPDEQSIAPPWRGKVDYFGEIATTILHDAAADDVNDREELSRAWGLVAARLGNKKNRSAFHSAFWFDEKDPNTNTSRDSIPGMQTRLTQWRYGHARYTPWATARENFHSAVERVDALIQEREHAESRLAQLPRLGERERYLEASIRTEGQSLDQLHDHLGEHSSVLGRAQSAHALAAKNRNRHLASKPGVLEVLFSFGRVIREWRKRLDEFTHHLELADQYLQETYEHGQQLQDAVDKCQARMSIVRQELANVRDKRARIQKACVQDEARFGEAYPGAAWQGDQRELRAPWLDEELDTARADLFIAALQLHQDFLANNAREMLNGLRAAIEVVAGTSPRNLDPEKVRASWQLFFLVVPLISTTFASAHRMFNGLGPESIGWLLIDEAGQACPQYAAGAIWRARRTVAVGDPLQLEPVVTLPEKVQRSIAAGHSVSPTWIPPRASVQTLADRVTRFGIMLDQGEEKVWVSAPLRVHRRCDDPMFTLCNQIAYNNLMVNGVHRDIGNPDRPDPFDSVRGKVIAASFWAHEPASVPGSHLQPNEIDRFESALAYLSGYRIPPSEVIAISPFRAVADRLRSLIPKYPGLRAGTIHTAQGREAAVVILVLGGDPSKPGAPTAWSRTPNLVNVAASRAKRRLYVIGDRSFWAGHNYFKELSQAFPPP